MSSRPSLRAQLNQIRLWLRQGRTDAWIAHKLDIPVDQLAQFKRDHKLNGGDERSEPATVAEPEPPEPSFEEEVEDELEVSEQAEEEPEEVREAEEPDDVRAGLTEEEEEPPEQPGDQPADDLDALPEQIPADVSDEDAEAVEPRGRDDEDAEAVEPRGRDGEDDGAERASRRRRRGRRGGRRRRSGETVYEATFEHGGEGYGLWLDPAVADSDVYLRNWAGHRAVTVTIKGEEITIRRAGGQEKQVQEKQVQEEQKPQSEPERARRRGSRRRSSSRRSSEPPPSPGPGGPASWLPE